VAHGAAGKFADSAPAPSGAPGASILPAPEEPTGWQIVPVAAFGFVFTTRSANQPIPPK
jgi:hypothetical protein